MIGIAIETPTREPSAIAVGREEPAAM